MFKRMRVSPAMLIAVIALVVAVGGTSIAASPVVTGAKKKKSKHKDAKPDKKLFKSLLKSATSAPKLAVLSATNATHAASADNATHAASADNATTAGSAQPVAFAFINGDTVSHNKTITSANVSHPGSGKYCISGLPFTIRGGQVTTQFEGSGGTTAQFTADSTGNCPNGGQILLWSGGTTPTLGDTGFYVMVYG